MARIRGMGKGAAGPRWCRGSLYSVRPRAALERCERRICRRGLVHMDANCPPGRARPRNVVARGEVAHLCVDAGENVYFCPCRSARSSMAGRPYVRIHNLRLLATSAEHS